MTLRDFENGYWYLESWMESLQAAVAPCSESALAGANADDLLNLSRQIA